ncbi:UNVERIFIED_CONTAM: hypothetical protein FKN15_074848 [Acipenser sinensis]
MRDTHGENTCTVPMRPSSEATQRVLAARAADFADVNMGLSADTRPGMRGVQAKSVGPTPMEDRKEGMRSCVKLWRFEGRGSWGAFHCAFEAIAQVNNWSELEKEG